MRGTFAGAACLALSCFAAACDCGAEDTLATLARRSRTVERNATAGGWTGAKVGDRFELGDAVRTGAR